MDFGTFTIFLAVAFPLFATYQLGATAGIFSERAGVANVAIEGNMIIGAVLYAVLFSIFSDASGLAMPQWIAITLAIIITMFVAGFYMMILSHITNKYMGDHIIVGTGMNLLAPALAFLMWFFISPAASPTSHSAIIDIVYNSNINVMQDKLRFFNLTWLQISFVVMAIVISIVAAWFLNETKFGLRLRSSGENPFALETSGVSVARTRRTALYIAGMLSSLAGMAFLSKGTFFFTVKGSGFLAIGIMIIGQYRIGGAFIGSVLLAVLIAFFDVVGKESGILPDVMFLQNYSFIMRTIPFIVPLIGLMVFKKSYAPNAVGKNFKKDQR